MAAPTAFHLHRRQYAKTYNLLSHFTADDIRINAYVNQTLFDLPTDNRLPCARNVHIKNIDAASKPGYLLSAFRMVEDRIRRGNVDVYMHMNLDYRWFNPLVVTGRTADVPVVIGPSQAGHSIKAEEFDLIVNRNPFFDVPSNITQQAFKIADPILRAVVDPIRLKLFKRTVQRADRVIVVHEDAKRVYEQFIDPSQISVIPLGVSPEKFEFAERKHTHDVVAVGLLRERKGYDILLDAFETVCQEVPEATLHIFGDGPLESELKNQAKRLNIRNHVTFHGFVDQSIVHEYMQRARVFVHPSRSESFSLVRLEAMSTGCPMVVSDIPGATEMITEGEEGFVVPVGDSTALATSMVRILTDIDLARELGWKARKKVERQYDWRIIGQQYIDVIREVA